MGNICVGFKELWYTLTNVLMAGIYLRGLQNADMGSDISEAWNSSQAGLRADGAGESALPAEESPSAGSANSGNFIRK